MTKRIYRPSSTVEADLLRSILQERGIESTLENDHSSQWNYRSVTAPLSISVADGDELRALAILEEHFRNVKEGAAGRAGGYAQEVASRRKSRARRLVAFYAVVICIVILASAIAAARAFLRR